MKIKTKILIPSLAAVMMMLILGIVAYLGMKTMQQALGTVGTKGVQHITLLNDTRSRLLEANVGAYRLFATMANFDEARINKETAVILGRIDDSSQILKKLRERDDIDAEEKQGLAKFDEPLARYRKGLEPLYFNANPIAYQAILGEMEAQAVDLCSIATIKRRKGC